LSYVFSRNGGTAAATNRETNQREITQLELRHELVQVLSESVVVVAGCWLAGLAEPSAVIRDDTATCGQKHRDTAAGGGIAKKILYSNRGHTSTKFLRSRPGLKPFFSERILTSPQPRPCTPAHAGFGWG
jgi:hypothetical protein